MYPSVIKRAHERMGACILAIYGCCLLPISLQYCLTCSTRHCLDYVCTCMRVHLRICCCFCECMCCSFACASDTLSYNSSGPEPQDSTGPEPQDSTHRSPRVHCHLGQFPSCVCYYMSCHQNNDSLSFQL